MPTTRGDQRCGADDGVGAENLFDGAMGVNLARLRGAAFEDVGGCLARGGCVLSVMGWLL